MKRSILITTAVVAVTVAALAGTNGQDSHDFGAGWYVLSPAGKKIESAGPVGSAPRVGPLYPSRYYAR